MAENVWIQMNGKRLNVEHPPHPQIICNLRSELEL